MPPVPGIPGLGDETKDIEIAERLTWGTADLFDMADASFGVDESTFLFTPTCGGEKEVSELGGFGGVIQILDHEEFEFGECFAGAILLDPGVSGVGGDDPQPFDVTGVNPVDDLVIGPALLGWDVGGVDA